MSSSLPIKIKLNDFSNFQKIRGATPQELPKAYQSHDYAYKLATSPAVIDPKISPLFPSLSNQNPTICSVVQDTDKRFSEKEIRIGIVLSGGQAPGGHNVIAGVYDFVKRQSKHGKVFGFRNGPKGIYENHYTEIDDEAMNSYRNQGGFDMICAGRNKIETEEHKKASLDNCTKLNLDGLIVIGGDDSNTNACILADYFAEHKAKTRVIGVPKTIDGDLKNEYIDVSFGFATATSVYCEEIGNICMDVMATKNEYHFVRLMGRSASHITWECELRTMANLAFIGEEVSTNKQTLSQIVNEIVEMICWRAEKGINFGVILLPEGLVEFIPEMNTLISEINEILAHQNDTTLTPVQIESYVDGKLTESNKQLFKFLPTKIRHQWILDRDPHGNVQVAKIEMEELLILLVTPELEKRKESKTYKGSFTPISHYFGYEGRCALPSLFDSDYCYALGYNAGCLINLNLSGYMSVMKGCENPPSSWKPMGIPLMTMMNVERRKGKDVPVIKKALVELDGEMYLAYKKIRDELKINDSYLIPGPIQFNYLTEGECKTTQSEEFYLNNRPYIIKCENWTVPKKTKATLSYLSKHRISSEVCISHSWTRDQKMISKPYSGIDNAAVLKERYPNIFNPVNKIMQQTEFCNMGNDKKEKQKLGVLLCGKYLVPGVNNIIYGMTKYKEWNPETEIIGFLGGVDGWINEKFIDLTSEKMELYKNHSGCDILCGDKVVIPDLAAASATFKKWNLTGVVIVFPSASLWNVISWNEHLLCNKINTSIIGIPFGLFNSKLYESPLGFDSVNKLYSQLIGNIMTDSASATKYWHFISLYEEMRSSFHTLSAALQTHPNISLIGEELQYNGYLLNNVVDHIAKLIVRRAEANKNYGVITIPNNLFKNLADMNMLISEMNALYSQGIVQEADVLGKLSEISIAVLHSWPSDYQKRLLNCYTKTAPVQFDCDLFPIEKLLITLVSDKLISIKKNKNFNAVGHFLGYQCRSSLPSSLDAGIGYNLGFLSCKLIENGVTCHLPTVNNTTKPFCNYSYSSAPLCSLLDVRDNSEVLIHESKIEFDNDAFIELKKKREEWIMNERYSNPGPIQFDVFGRLEKNTLLDMCYSERNNALEIMEEHFDAIRKNVKNGSKNNIKATLSLLESVRKID